MKKLTSILLAVMLVVSMCCVGVVAASAEEGDTKEFYTATGSANLFGDSSWDPENTVFALSKDEATGLWYVNIETVGMDGKTPITVPTGEDKIVFKVTNGLHWETPGHTAWGEGNAPGGPDKVVDFTGFEDVEIKSITIIFDGSTVNYRINNLFVPGGEEPTSPVVPTEPTTEQPKYTPDPAKDEAYAAGHGDLFGTAYDPANENFKMKYDATIGKWFVNIKTVGNEVDGEKYVTDQDLYKVAYKVALNGTYDISYNDKGQAVGYDTDAFIDFTEFGTDVEIDCITIYFDLATLCTSYEINKEYIPTVPTTPEPTKPEPTEPEKDYAVITSYDAGSDKPSETRKYNVGDIFTYTVYLQGSDKNVAAYDLHTWFNQTGQGKATEGNKPVVELYAEEGKKPYKFEPYFATSVINPETQPNQILYNWAVSDHLDLDFSVDGGIEIVTLTFKVLTAGESSIWTDINQLLKNGATVTDPAIDIKEGSVVHTKLNPDSTVIEPTDPPTEVPTDAPTDAPTDGPTDAPTTVDPTKATGTVTDPAPTTPSKGGNGSGSTTTGKVSTGDSAPMALLLGTLLLAAGVIVVTRKKITE